MTTEQWPNDWTELNPGESVVLRAEIMGQGDNPLWTTCGDHIDFEGSPLSQELQEALATWGDQYLDVCAQPDLGPAWTAQGELLRDRLERELGRPVRYDT